MWIAALVTSAVLMFPGQVENVTYKVCMYNCFAFCREGYTDAERAECERQRLSCQRNCIMKYPTEFKGCNPGWQPTAQGCKCIKPLINGGICPR
jgi:hypothetical protein